MKKTVFKVISIASLIIWSLYAIFRILAISTNIYDYFKYIEYFDSDYFASINISVFSDLISLLTPIILIIYFALKLANKEKRILFALSFIPQFASSAISFISSISTYNTELMRDFLLQRGFWTIIEILVFAFISIAVCLAKRSPIASKIFCFVSAGLFGLVILRDLPLASRNYDMIIMILTSLLALMLIYATILFEALRMAYGWEEKETFSPVEYSYAKAEEDLALLKQIYEAGAITEEEYTEKKKNILEKM